MSRINMARSS